MRDDFDSLQKMIQGTLHSEFYLKKAKAILKPFDINGDKLQNAWAYWVCTQMSFSYKLFGGFAFGTEDRSTQITCNKREAFDYVFYNRIKKVEIFNRDALDLVNLKDNPETFFYFDPPYPESDCGTYNHLKEVYYRLLTRLPSIKCNWLMSSYPSEQLTELRKEHGWHFKDIDQNVGVSGKNKKGKRKLECLTWNYDVRSQNKNIFGDHY